MTPATFKVKHFFVLMTGLLLALSCSPLAVTQVTMDDCGCLHWQTNLSARCMVTWCDDSQCHSSEWESINNTDHCYPLQRYAHNIVIYSISGEQKILTEVEDP